MKGCISFLCSLFCKKGSNITQPSSLRWTLFKAQGISKAVESLPPTLGAWEQHIRRAHCQAAAWQQDLIVHPRLPDFLKLGWMKVDNHLVPKLYDVEPAPSAVVEFARCRCGASRPSVHLHRVHAEQEILFAQNFVCVMLTQIYAKTRAFIQTHNKKLCFN